MKSQLGGIRRKFMDNHLITTEYESQDVSSSKEENIIEWLTLFQSFRRNWHIYVDMVLGIKLRPFQMIMIYLMGISDIFYAICSRGLSKITAFIGGFTLEKKKLSY